MNKIISLFILYLFLHFPARAQDSLAGMDEVIIYSSKFAERKKNVVQQMEVITAATIARTNAQNTGDLLAQSGNVFVQKSQQGGSSPVLRGFEASRVLLVIDGVRMNNAIYRAGHLQNIITVDQNMLDRVEVLYGPASTLYGSDALGGVVLLRTRQPVLSFSSRPKYTGNIFTRFNSSNNEKAVHADLSIGGRKLGWLQSYTISDFGDMRMGDKYRDTYPDFGRRSQYVTRINNADTIVTNQDDRIQKFSAYRQWDMMQKLLFKSSERWSHALNVQYSSSTNVPRYDRLQDIRNGRLRWAEWYYGPQQRTMASFETTLEGAGYFNTARAILSYQDIHESRFQRAFRNNILEARKERIGVWNATLDAIRKFRQHELTVGMDAQLNDVRSRAYTRDITTGAEGKLDTRYPNGKNNMNYFGVYAQHLKKWGSKWVLNDGIRVQAVKLHARVADNSFFNFPFTGIRQENIAVTGNIGAVFMPDSNLRMTIGVSSGFRAPNIDDAARVVEPPVPGRLTIPNSDIKPEYTYNADLGMSYKFGRTRFELNGFYTLFRNAIALAPFRLNGADSLSYNGSLAGLYANQNINKAFITGGHASFTAYLPLRLELFSTINYTYGRLKPKDAGEVPLDHIPPLFGKTSLTYSQKNLRVEAYSLYNGWKKMRDYNPNGEDNPQYATADGTPSWITFNLRGSITWKSFTLQAALENIADRNYRYFASGFSAPGRSVMVALRYQF